MGVAKSRNIALKKSRGQYLAFIDSDDIWNRDKLDKQLKFMKKNLINFSFTSYSIINEQDKTLKILIKNSRFLGRYFRLFSN